jgi:transcriptional regulator with XRE-family HTH domain
LSFTLGAFPVETIDCTQAVSVSTCGSNKWLYGGQAVFATALRSSSNLKLGLAYYVWDNYEGRLNSPVVNPADRTYIPKFSQKGNTYFNVVTNGGNPLLGLAPNYNEVDLTAGYDFGYWDPVRVIFTADVVKNIGYNQEEIAQRTGTSVEHVLEGSNQPTSVKIYNVAGRLVATLLDEPRSPGKYRVDWTARGQDGVSLASGVYYVKLQIGKRSVFCVKSYVGGRTFRRCEKLECLVRRWWRVGGLRRHDGCGASHGLGPVG